MVAMLSLPNRVVTGWYWYYTVSASRHQYVVSTIYGFAQPYLSRCAHAVDYFMQYATMVAKPLGGCVREPHVSSV